MLDLSVFVAPASETMLSHNCAPCARNVAERTDLRRPRVGSVEGQGEWPLTKPRLSGAASRPYLVLFHGRALARISDVNPVAEAGATSSQCVQPHWGTIDPRVKLLTLVGPDGPTAAFPLELLKDLVAHLCQSNHTQFIAAKVSTTGRLLTLMTPMPG